MPTNKRVHVPNHFCCMLLYHHQCCCELGDSHSLSLTYTEFASAGSNSTEDTIVVHEDRDGHSLSGISELW